MENYKIVAIVGKSGAGKDFIKNQLLSTYPDLFAPVIGYTTRPPRANEKDGVNYHFVSENDFSRLIYEKQMLEYTQFRGWHYGTSIQGLDSQKINLGVLNPEGVKILKENLSQNDIVTVYILASGKTRLLRDLNREDLPNCTEICRRYLTDTEDFKQFSADYFFLNENKEITVKELDQIKNSILKILELKEAVRIMAAASSKQT